MRPVKWVLLRACLAVNGIVVTRYGPFVKEADYASSTIKPRVGSPLECVCVTLSAEMLRLLGRLTASLVFLFSLHAQNPPPEKPHPIEVTGVPPRSGPSDYAAHVQMNDFTLAAEFAGHNVPRPEGPLTTDDYVVVEVALYGPAGAKLNLSPDQFSLQINDKKPFPAVTFVVVASSLKDPEWVPPDQPKEKQKTSFGGGGGQDPAPLPPKVPFELRRKMAQYIEVNSLPQGEHALPKAGLLFFPFRSKTQSIHSMELSYKGPAGQGTIALQP